MLSSGAEILVTRTVPPPLAKLEKDWRELESRGEHSFFMSWFWIGSWLERLPEDVPRWLLRAQSKGRIVGLGVICANTVRRQGVFVSRGLHLHLHLHRTGRPELDELTVEYNGFLAEDGLERQVTQRCIEFLSSERDWDEMYLDAWHRLDLLGSMQIDTLRSARVVRRPCPYVDLAALRRAN